MSDINSEPDKEGFTTLLSKAIRPEQSTPQKLGEQVDDGYREKQTRQRKVEDTSD